MARIEPHYDVQIFNDPAISPGTPVESIFTMQYDGFIIGAMFRAAGAEGLKLTFSDGEEAQHIPAVDVAVDSDTLGMSQGPSPGKSFNGFTLMNKPTAKGTKIGMVQEGTGTGEGNVYLLTSLTPEGPLVLNKAVLVDISASVTGDTLIDCPTFMDRLKRCFIRGQGAENLTIQLGAGGQTITIPCRSIPINTDVEPWTYHSIDSDTPDKVLFVGMNGFTGTNAWLYWQFE